MSTSCAIVDPATSTEGVQQQLSDEEIDRVADSADSSGHRQPEEVDSTKCLTAATTELSSPPRAVSSGSHDLGHDQGPIFRSEGPEVPVFDEQLAASLVADGFDATAVSDSNQATTSAAAGPERPTDEAILAQTNLIREEQAAKTDYIANRETLDSLKAEYQSGSETFLRKIEKLEATYSHVRRIRGDGNCFFRAFIFSYLEQLMLSQDWPECHRLAKCVEGWRAKLIEQNYQELVFEDALGLLLDQLAGISRVSDPTTQEMLEVQYRDAVASNTIVFLLRLITSAEIQRREDFFLPFILGMYDDAPQTVDLFCQRLVQPMGEESDHIHIVAITDALQVPVRVVYLDNSNGGFGDNDADVVTHDFVPEGLPQNTFPRVHLLYRPGHYDQLYLAH